MRGMGRAVLALSVLAGASVQAADAVSDSESYLRWKSELRQMVESRNLDKFEFDFRPMTIDRIVLPSRLGDNKVFHYVTFRLRNKVSANAEYMMQHRSAFNEVMQQIAEEFEEVTYQTEGGPRLFTEAPTIEDPDLATIVESEDLKVAKRQALITASIYDENGGAFTQLEEDPATSPINEFDIEDLGEVREGNVYERVRYLIEEREHRRLLSMHEIRQMELPPYDADKLNDEGVAQGEVFGVLIFDRLPVVGDRFTLRIQGLSNKLRVHVPEHEDDQLADYINTRYKRRVYVMEIERPGDEFFLGDDPLTVVEQGWRWVPAFERIRQRASVAYSTYFLNNHPLEREQMVGNDPVLKNQQVDQAFWQHMGQTREQIGEIYDQKIARVEKQKARLQERYDELLDGERLNESEVLRRLQGFKQGLDERKQMLVEGKREALKALATSNFEANLETKQ